jgi:hypothetical protein
MGGFDETRKNHLACFLGSHAKEVLNASTLKNDMLEVVIDVRERAIGPRPSHDAGGEDAMRRWFRGKILKYFRRPGDTLCRNPGDVSNFIGLLWGC